MSRFYSFIVLLMFSSGFVLADQIMLSQEERDEIMQFRGLEAQPELGNEADNLLLKGFDSIKDNVSLSALRVVLIHRKREFWNEHMSLLDGKKGTTAKLAKISEDIFKNKDINKPLISLYSEQTLEMLPIKGVRPIWPKSGDLPIDYVLLDLAVIDAVKNRNYTKTVLSTKDLDAALAKIDDYFLVTRQQKMLKENYVIVNESIYY